jgi:hypothetical protein
LFNSALSAKALAKSKTAILRLKGLHSAAELKGEFNDMVEAIGELSYSELQEYFPRIMKIGLNIDSSRNMAQLQFYNKFYNTVQQQVTLTGIKMISQVYINIAADRVTIPMLGLFTKQLGPVGTIEYSTKDIRSYLNESN